MGAHCDLCGLYSTAGDGSFTSVFWYSKNDLGDYEFEEKFTCAKCTLPEDKVLLREYYDDSRCIVNKNEVMNYFVKLDENLIAVETNDSDKVIYLPKSNEDALRNFINERNNKE